MAVTKLSVSLDENLATQVRERARLAGRSVSAIVSEAVADGLRREALRDAIAEWEAEHGVITEEMIDEVRAGLVSWTYVPDAVPDVRQAG